MELRNNGSLSPSNEGKYIASIDLGSHTARFLVCKIFEPPVLFRPVARKRFYTNLADGFNSEDKGVIKSDSFKKAVNAIDSFIKMAEEYSVKKIVGAATGVFRRAENSKDLLNEIRERTGVEIKTVSGEEEAALTLKGIFHALGLSDYPDVFFDLGGSTTEFVYKTGNKIEIISLPIGAFVLSDMFFKHDPPSEDEISMLKHYVSDIINENIGAIFNCSEDFTLIGSGGTVTSLAAIMMNLDKKDVAPDTINGSLLAQDEIKEIYNNIYQLPLTERLKIKNIDEGRAKVILAGTLAVLSIIEFFKANNLTVSYSDILEGLILSYLEGEKDE
jgi:exopolyphosphatase/guanosine-5'-triphosphate,3'-diphosphate pyrophosphatase